MTTLKYFKKLIKNIKTNNKTCQKRQTNTSYNKKFRFFSLVWIIFQSYKDFKIRTNLKRFIIKKNLFKYKTYKKIKYNIWNHF